MKARAVAETPPVISSMTPKSQVIIATEPETIQAVVGRYRENSVPNIDDNNSVVVKNRCRCGLKSSCEKKNCSIT